MVARLIWFVGLVTPAVLLIVYRERLARFRMLFDTHYKWNLFVLWLGIGFLLLMAFLVVFGAALGDWWFDRAR